MAEKESSRKNKVCQWQTLPASVPRRFVRAFGDEQIGFEDKKRQLRNSELSFWRRRRDSLRYPSPKNSPPDCFSIKIKIFMAAQSTPSSPIKIKNDPVFTGSFFGGEGGTRTLAPVLGRPTPLAGAPRHQLEYFSRLVSGLRLFYF